MNLDRIKDHQRLTLERARELLEADPAAGVFRWRTGPRAGLIAGSRPKERSSYCQIVIDGSTFAQHRLMWLLCTGAWPRFIVDHINGNRQDNRIANLRDVPHSVGQRNQAYHRAGMSKAQWDAPYREGRKAAIQRLQNAPQRLIYPAEIEA